MLMALYGMLIASILYYKKFRKDIESIGFEVNPYDICVANRRVQGKAAYGYLACRRRQVVACEFRGQ
jgi:hypothetical protein